MHQQSRKKQSTRKKVPIAVEKRRIPVSIDDFKNIIEENYAYVDKTLFIQELWESGADVSIIPRPRRFGKTVNMSTLRYFFEKSEKSNAHLFANLKIWQLPKYRKLQGTFPVIFLSLKGVKDALDWESAFNRIKLIISEEYSRHRYLFQSQVLEPNEKQFFMDIINRTASMDEYSFSLKYLSKWLSRFHQSKVIILIDEYDSPIINAYMRGFYDPMLSFMRAWLGEGLKGNPHLERGVITGILRVAKEDLFSSLNNPVTYTILNEPFADKFGFLEEEVCALLEEYGLTDKLEEMRKWYNGYRIGTSTVYNPWSVNNCLQRGGTVGAYWVNTGGTGLLDRLLLQGGTDLKGDLEEILAGHESIRLISEGTPLSSLDRDGSSVWNILLFSGYLTLAAPPVLEEGEVKCSLRIPNYEVDCLYKHIIKNWFYETIKEDGASIMLKSLLNGDIDTFETIFNKFILETMSYYDLSEDEPEKIYHALVLGMLVFLRETHEIKSNRESGYGRYDVLVIPKNSKELGIVIEFKVFNSSQNKNLAAAAESGLKQIKEKKYSQELHQRGIKKVLAICMAFRGKQLFIKHKMV